MTLQPGIGRAKPGLYRPGYHYTVLDAMVAELQIERTPEAQGLWLANTVQPTWELGRRFGVPDTLGEALDIFGQAAFLTGPTEGRRWLVCGVVKPVTTGATKVFIRPKSSADSIHRLTISTTEEVVINLPWPGIPIEHQKPFDGGQLGLDDSGNAGDTARVLRILFYDVEC